MKIMSGVVASAMFFVTATGSANAACYEVVESTATLVFNVADIAEGKNTLLMGIGYHPGRFSGVAIGGIVDFVSNTPPPGPKLLTINWAPLGEETCLISSALSANGTPVPGTANFLCGTSSPIAVTLLKLPCSSVPPPSAPAGNNQGPLSLLRGSAGKAAQ